MHTNTSNKKDTFFKEYYLFFVLHCLYIINYIAVTFLNNDMKNTNRKLPVTWLIVNPLQTYLCIKLPAAGRAPFIVGSVTEYIRVSYTVYTSHYSTMNTINTLTVIHRQLIFSPHYVHLIFVHLHKYSKFHFFIWQKWWALSNTELTLYNEFNIMTHQY